MVKCYADVVNTVVSKSDNIHPFSVTKIQSFSYDYKIYIGHKSVFNHAYVIFNCIKFYVKSLKICKNMWLTCNYCVAEEYIKMDRFRYTYDSHTHDKRQEFLSNVFT